MLPGSEVQIKACALWLLGLFGVICPVSAKYLSLEGDGSHVCQNQERLVMFSQNLNKYFAYFF